MVGSGKVSGQSYMTRPRVVPRRTTDWFIVQQLVLCARWRRLTVWACANCTPVDSPRKLIRQGLLRHAVTLPLPTGLARKYQWYYIMIVSWYILNINLYYYYLLTFLIHAYLIQTAQVPKLLDAAKILTKILTLWVGSNNVTDDRHRRTAHAIRRT